MIKLNISEQRKYDTIKDLVDNVINIQRASVTLNCSIRNVYRLVKKYTEEGISGFKHGNSGKIPVHALKDNTKKLILDLYLTKYFDSNFEHYSELLAEYEKINVSPSAIRKLLFNNGYILSPKARRKTRKDVAKILREKKKGATVQEATKIDNILLCLEDAHPRRPRCAYEGELIQMDASVHEWFGNEKSNLHIAVDDCTGAIVGAYFDKQETLKGYYNITYQMITKYGIPFKILTDKRTVFEYKKSGKTEVENDTFTQYSYACSQLGIELVTSSVSQAKGRVERMFQTLQSRLLVELRLANVRTIEEANEFLQQYIENFNSKFALPINNTKSVFVNQDSTQKLNLTLAVLTSRKIDCGHCIKYNNNYYKLIDFNGNYAYYRKGTIGLVIKAFDNQLFFSTDDKVYALETVPEHERLSKNFDPPVQTKEKKPYIPPMNHPWKQKSFETYMKKMAHRKNVVA